MPTYWRYTRYPPCGAEPSPPRPSGQYPPRFPVQQSLRQRAASRLYDLEGTYRGHALPASRKVLIRKVVIAQSVQSIIGAMHNFLSNMLITLTNFCSVRSAKDWTDRLGSGRICRSHAADSKVSVACSQFQGVPRNT